MTNREGPRRHLFIGDTQVRPGVPLDHLDWVAQAIVDYKPDVIVHAGDHFDFPSLSGHEEPGSAPLEGQRYKDDLDVGNAAFARLCKPMEDEQVNVGEGAGFQQPVILSPGKPAVPGRGCLGELELSIMVPLGPFQGRAKHPQIPSNGSV